MESEQVREKGPKTFELRQQVPTTCLQKYSFMLIRPPRFVYNEQILNPHRRYRNRFQYTLYHIPFPLSVYTPVPTRYIILYLHGSSSSRYQGYLQLGHLPSEVGLACFDFAGCGNREESYISLGIKEAEEVDRAVRFLREKGFKVGIWGRSMGGVSALLSKEGDVVVADSPFSDLKGVCRELSEAVMPSACRCLLYCVFPCLLMAVGCDVKQKVGIDIGELNLLEQINNNTNRKIMFLAAKEDKMIHYGHSMRLYEQYRGQYKQLMLFNGTHNSERPLDTLLQVFVFIDNALNSQSELSEPKSFKLRDRVGKKVSEAELMDVRSCQMLKEVEQMSEMKNSSRVEINSKNTGLSDRMNIINEPQASQSEKH